MSYDNPQTSTYSILGATLSSATTLGRIAGPAGKTGIVKDISVSVTTGVTVAANLLSVGITGTLGKFATQSIPIIGVDNVIGGVTQVADIAAGESVLVSTDGGCTAGAADVFVTIDWF